MHIKQIIYYIYYMLIAHNPLFNLPLTFLQQILAVKKNNGNKLSYLIVSLSAFALVSFLYASTGELYIDILFLIIILCKGFDEQYLNTLSPVIVTLLSYSALGMIWTLRELSEFSYHWGDMEIYSESWSLGYSLYAGSINGLGYHTFLSLMLAYAVTRRRVFLISNILYLIVINIATGFHVKAPILVLFGASILSYIILLDYKKAAALLMPASIICLSIITLYDHAILEYLNPDSNMRIAEYVGAKERTNISVESTFIRIYDLYGLVGLCVLIFTLLYISKIIVHKSRSAFDRATRGPVLMLYISLILMMFFTSDILLVYIHVMGFSWLYILNYMRD